MLCYDFCLQDLTKELIYYHFKFFLSVGIFVFLQRLKKMGDMRKLIVCIFLSLSLPVLAQGNSVRDSLRAAIDLMQYYPDSVDLRLKKARWNMELEEWARAKDEYDIVLRIDPTNIAALYFRAFANEKMGRYNFARLDYENLLSYVPGNFEAQLGLALLNQKDKHYTEAFDQINRLCAQYPDSSIAFAARAGIEAERGLLDLAEYDYSEAIKRNNDNIDYKINRVDILIRLGKIAAARKELDDMVAKGVPRALLVDIYKRIK